METVTLTKITPPDMTAADWSIAYTVAQTLTNDETDVNEVKKATAYLRFAIRNNSVDAGTQFFKYLKLLVSQGRTIGHSGKTLEYYRNFDQVCNSYLRNYQLNPLVLLCILGWIARLMRYFKADGVIDQCLTIHQIPTVSTAQVQDTELQAKIRSIARSQNFQLGQHVETIVKNIKGKEVTYELPGGIKLTVKEPKKYSDLSIDKIVKVEILELRDNGVPKKVKWIN